MVNQEWEVYTCNVIMIFPSEVSPVIFPLFSGGFSEVRVPHYYVFQFKMIYQRPIQMSLALFCQEQATYLVWGVFVAEVKAEDLNR